MKATVYIKNTLTGKKEPFVPLVPGKMGMYVCGPTVYGEPHLGHARSAITFDIVYRYFSYLGYQVRYVRNITDVGHLEDEVNGQGEDKIAKKARLERLEPMEVAQYYTNLYRKMMASLNVLPPSIEPTASGHIIEQIAIVEQIIANGMAYEAEGSVYFDLKAYLEKYPYGELSGRMPNEMMAGSRILDGQKEKKHPADFALWKKAGAQHIMQWNSPWGMGFPGWHLECTAMSHKYLGFPFDLHGGGMDLKFPHHEAEVAQSYAAFGCKPVNYWMHNNMMTLEGQKMSKSKDNFITIAQMFSGKHPLLNKAYSPTTVRFLMLQAHYGSTIDFSRQALHSAEKACHKLLDGLRVLNELSVIPSGPIDDALTGRTLQLCKACFDTMNDDFNTAETIACLFELYTIVQTINDHQHSKTISQEALIQLKKIYPDFLTQVLGIVPKDEATTSLLPQVMDILLDLRHQARKENNFTLSDIIRDQLLTLGIHIRDEKEGTSYQIKS